MSNNFRLGDLGVIAALVVNIIIGTWEIAHLDGRVGSLEREQLKEEVSIDALKTSDSEKAMHLLKLDDAITTMKDQVSTILDIVRAPPDSGDTKQEPNFPKHK